MGFKVVPKENLVSVGRVDEKSARVWFRAERPGRYLVELTGPGGKKLEPVVVEIAPDNARDNTATVDCSGLADLTRYNFTVAAEDGTVFVGEGRFETAPSTAARTSEHFSVGVLSCHQPFEGDGSIAPRSMRLLDHLPDLFGKYDIKFLLPVGDQMYADGPGELSLMSPHYLKSRWPDRGDLGSWSLEQIRQAYQERHRIFWNQVPWLKLLASFPNYSILDDHEVFDDWGSIAAHQEEPYTKIVEAARSAYLDYQGSRQLPWTGVGPVPAALDYGFRYGTVATFVFDLRSERRTGANARVVSAEQIGRFKAFLAANRDAHAMLVVTSVPLVHIPEWVTAAGKWVLGNKVDFADHWSAPQNTADRNAILGVIREHLTAAPKQRLIVLGGDVHVGCAFELHLVGGAKPLFFELTTSSVTNRLKSFEADASILGPKSFGLTPRMAGGLLDVSLLQPAKDAPARNPIGGLNVGLVEFKRNGDETNVRLKLIGYDDKHDVREEFVSRWL